MGGELDERSTHHLLASGEHDSIAHFPTQRLPDSVQVTSTFSVLVLYLVDLKP
jgi:hypothetical protein